jgi:hypothetical protein
MTDTLTRTAPAALHLDKWLPLWIGLAMVVASFSVSCPVLRTRSPRWRSAGSRSRSGWACW